APGDPVLRNRRRWPGRQQLLRGPSQYGHPDVREEVHLHRLQGEAAETPPRGHPRPDRADHCAHGDLPARRHPPACLLHGLVHGQLRLGPA
ncbi:unnamed protein product, partial [Prorocentrum cordatum]